MFAIVPLQKQKILYYICSCMISTKQYQVRFICTSFIILTGVAFMFTYLGR